MKKFQTALPSILLSILFLSLLQINLSAKKPPQPTIKIKSCIDIPPNVQENLKFPIFFGGIQKLSDPDGFFSFTAKINQLDILSVLICKEFKQLFETNNKKGTNTVNVHYIDRRKPYKYLLLSKDANKTLSWEEQTLPSDKIPDNCIVILMNPKIVNDVETWKISLPKGILPLTKINLKTDLEEKYLAKKSNKALLGTAIDTRKFHETVPEVIQEIKKENKIKVTLAEPPLV